MFLKQISLKMQTKEMKRLQEQLKVSHRQMLESSRIGLQRSELE